jgi:cobalt-zinc-cadmium resistance protein CzcA
MATLVTDPEAGGDFNRLLRAVIERSVRNRLAAPFLAALILGLGIWSLRRLPLDVTPDISNVQVQILTAVPDLSPEEIENSVTRPLELELFGLPHLEQMRSLTRFGISQICLIFSDGTDLFQARQSVAERLAQTPDQLPAGLVPRLAPPSSGLGEVFTYALTFRDSQAANVTEAGLRRLKMANEFLVKPCLKTVPGVAEINTTGGYDQQMVVAVDPTRLGPLGLDLNDIALILQRNAAIGGGALVERDGTQFIIRSRARVQWTNDLANLCIRLSLAAETITLKQVATVSIASGIRLGAATLNGKEAVLGTALLLNGENAAAVAAAFRLALADAQARLPADLELKPLYDRSELVDRVISTVRQNLLLAAGLVLAVLLGFLGNWRAAVIVASVLFLAFALAVTGLAALGIMGSLMTLGAIDFGVVVDDTIVMVENVARGLQTAGATANRRSVIVESCCQVRKPMLVGMLVIIGAYLPVLTLGGVEGRMFRPLAQSVILLLAGSLFLTLTLVPAFCVLGLGKLQPVREPRFMAWLRARYEKLFSLCRQFRWLVLIPALLPVAGAIWLGPRLGADFLPSLDEEWLVVEVQRPPQTSLARSVVMEEQTEQAIRAAVPEVQDCFARIGMSAIATDPQGANQNDIYISFRPRSTWRNSDGRKITKAGLAHLLVSAIKSRVPGQDLELNQPIAVRFDELLAGVRTDVAIKIFGDDYDQLDTLARRVADLVKKEPGASEVVVDQPGRTDTFEFQPNREAMLRYMATSDQVNNAVAIGLAGRIVGRIDEGPAFYPLTVRVAENFRTNRDVLNLLPLRAAADGSLVLGLGNLGTWTSRPAVTAITREQAARREAILISARVADVAGFVNRIRRELAQKIKLPAGYRVEFSGAYQHWESGSRRLAIAAGAVLLASLLLIYAALQNWRQTALVAMGIPFALAGGIYGLWFRDLPFTLPAAAGLVTLGGLSLLNGMVLMTRFNQLLAEGLTPLAAALQSATTRLRPVLMTALVASLGFVPMAVSQGIGAEVQRPFATVVIFGILSSTGLTLVLLPLWLAKTAVPAAIARSSPGLHRCVPPALR